MPSFSGQLPGEPVNQVNNSSLTGKVMCGYQAMFDEIKKVTQILKVSNDPPVGASPFKTYGGLSSDHYLRLIGEALQMIGGQPSPTNHLPKRKVSE